MDIPYTLNTSAFKTNLIVQGLLTQFPSDSATWVASSARSKDYEEEVFQGAVYAPVFDRYESLLNIIKKPRELRPEQLIITKSEVLKDVPVNLLEDWKMPALPADTVTKDLKVFVFLYRDHPPTIKIQKKLLLFCTYELQQKYTVMAVYGPNFVIRDNMTE